MTKDTTKYIQVIVQEVKGCLIDKDYTFKFSVDKLKEVIEFIEKLEKK